MRFRFGLWMAVVVASFGPLACGGGVPTGPSAAAPAASQGLSAAGQSLATTSAAQPPFNLEAILRGDGFGLVKFRQEKDPSANIVSLDVWVRGVSPTTSYSLQRAVDAVLDGECTGTNWLTLGQGATPQPIV